MSTFVMNSGPSLNILWNICILVVIVFLGALCVLLEIRVKRNNKERRLDAESDANRNVAIETMLPKSFRKRFIGTREEL